MLFRSIMIIICHVTGGSVCIDKAPTYYFQLICIREHKEELLCIEVPEPQVESLSFWMTYGNSLAMQSNQPQKVVSLARPSLLERGSG